MLTPNRGQNWQKSEPHIAPHNTNKNKERQNGAKRTWEDDCDKRGKREMKSCGQTSKQTSRTQQDNGTRVHQANQEQEKKKN
jgi:hypothetical protein